MEKNTLSDILKKLRVEKGFTQSQMAEQINKSRTAYNKLENGKSALTVDDLGKFAKTLNLSSKEVLMVMNYNYDNFRQDEKDIINAYNKVIGFFIGALRYSFDILYLDGLGFSEVNFVPFENLPEEDKKNIEVIVGKKLTKESYEEYCSIEGNKILEEEYYSSFCLFLRDNPLAVLLLYYGLLGDYYEPFFERWCNDKDRINKFPSHSDEMEVFILRHQREFYSNLSLNPNEDLKNQMENFKKIINSENINFKMDTFSNSVTL